MRAVTKNRDRKGLFVHPCEVRICQSATGGGVTAPDLPVILRLGVGIPTLSGSPSGSLALCCLDSSFSEAHRGCEGPTGPPRLIGPIDPSPGVPSRQQPQQGSRTFH